jgi:hypothetical protein
VAVLVRDLDVAPIERAKEPAGQHGRALQGEAKMLLEPRAAARTMTERISRRLAGNTFADGTDLIREDRDR